MLMSKENRIYLYKISFVKDYYGTTDLIKLTRTSDKANSNDVPKGQPIVYNLTNTHISSLDLRYERNTC